MALAARGEAMRANIETRKKLKNFYDVKTFDDLLNQCVLTEEEKQIVRLYYVKGKNLAYIGDLLGYSESTIKRRHQKILQKLGNLI